MAEIFRNDSEDDLQLASELMEAQAGLVASN